MRTLSVGNGLRFAMVVSLLGVAGCHSDPPRVVDSGTNHDTGPMVVDTGVVVDTGPPVDMGGTTGDTGPGGTCSYGGGCDLLTHSCPDAMGSPQGCFPGAMASQCASLQSMPIAAGMPCTHLNDCDEGYACVGPSSTTSVCTRVCCRAADCMMPGAVCQPLGDGMGNPLPNGVGVCHVPPACTAVPNSGCAAGNQCILVGHDGSTDCLPTGTAAEGGMCGGSTGMNCAEGLGCYGTTGGAASCFRFCRTAMMNADCTGSAHTCTDAGLGGGIGLCM